MSIDNCNRWGDTPLSEVMGHHIADGVDGGTGNFLNNFINVPVQIAKWFLEKLPVLFRKREHQRTFSA
jgi:hypothetical protein